jgi:hypothetical protein
MVAAKEDAMKLLRENIVPVAFLALWVAASGYTLHRLSGMRAAPVQATMNLTVTPQLGGAPHASCTELPGLRTEADI